MSVDHDDAAQYKLSLHPEPSQRRAAFPSLILLMILRLRSSVVKRNLHPAGETTRAAATRCCLRWQVRITDWQLKEQSASLMSKHASLLGKFSVAEQGSNCRK